MIYTLMSSSTFLLVIKTRYSQTLSFLMRQQYLDQMNILEIQRELPSADLEVQLVQLNHCDGVYSNY